MGRSTESAQESCLTKSLGFLTRQRAIPTARPAHAEPSGRDRARYRKFCAVYGGCHTSKRVEDSNSVRPFLSLVNEIRRCTRVQESTVRTQISKRQGEAALSLVDWWLRAFSGSPSFVAVVQPADLRHRHDRAHFRRLNRSWLRRVLPQRKMCSRSMIVIEIRIERSS